MKLPPEIANLCMPAKVYLGLSENYKDDITKSLEIAKVLKM